MTDAEKKPEDAQEETLAERSARLEAEAAGLSEAASSEPETEEETGENSESYDAAQSEIIIKTLQGEVDTLKDQAARALAERIQLGIPNAGQASER